MPDGSAREFTFYMEAKSIITRPSGGQRLTAKGFHGISGVAWSGHGKIRRVDVSVDGGKSWQEAQLQKPVLTRTEFSLRGNRMAAASLTSWSRLKHRLRSALQVW